MRFIFYYYYDCLARTAMSGGAGRCVSFFKKNTHNYIQLFKVQTILLLLKILTTGDKKSQHVQIVAKKLKKYQKYNLKDKSKKHIMFHMSCVTCHASRIICNMSPVPCH